MKKLILAVLAISFAAMFFGCGDKGTGPNGPETATITFRSDPENFPIVIWVDGEKLGPTPQPYTGAIGEEKHSLSVQVLGGDLEELGTFKIKGSTDVVFSPTQFGLWLATGQVRAEDGNALAGVKIEALNNSTIIASTQTQANGSFELYILKDFTSALRFSAEGYITMVIPIAEIPETGADIRLAKVLPPTTLTLNIFPISAEAEVWVDGDSLGSADPNGHFQTILEPGSHEIKFIGWGCKEKTVSLAISPGETESQNISLEIWDLSGKWKRESDDKEVDVEYYMWEGRRYVGGWNPAGGFLIKGNAMNYTDPYGGSSYAIGIILENGRRVEFTAYSQYGSSSYIYTKIS